MKNILQEIHGCRMCLDAGCESVHPPPIFEGSINASVLIIGQAPGIEEFNQKQPFVGSSGKRLFSWLKQAGLKEAWIREHTLIFQRYLCYPGKQPDGSGDRSPSSKQLDLCQPHLSRVLSLMTGLNLRLIIPVGRLAIDAFFPASKALEKIIGQRLKYSRALVVPLPHPSGLSRWYQSQEHRALIYRALEMIGDLNLTSTPLPR
jgi:uracil-DNA glycosylase